MLSVEAVSKRYGGGNWVLREVDLTVEPGAVVAIVGGNGSGKSTLLRLMVGVSRPTAGTVSGRPDVVGYVPERFPPNERLSAAAYLEHLGRIRGMNSIAAAERAEELLERLDLQGGFDAQVRTLSKGNAQKVALAQALLVPPGLLVLDEPWSGLDADAHGVLATIIAEVAAAGGAVVFTDHRESVTRANATRIHRIHDGRIAEATAPGRAIVEVALTQSGQDTEDPGWDEVDGVLTAVTHQGQLFVRVDRDHSDALLTIALRHGWSIDSVTPEKAAP
ncbi:ATP-binding cassette domain-containing protein [Actinokineospora globicatena]|uniref:ATP-binding cassette domain-containing protein n=1 Tax=Actinokineospora globicatena TaxID=103729 RepID=UPI0020A3F8BD|nr:ABC transporter ATP-binding protein [Actinokineospora globicatena]MCP2303248.1 ABC-type multidrug transport system, ATPase component [Actinokineospora globicatena]GLW79624.1 ABC transporter ATP-binding protein [Actinokineospora globicatena]GLW85966.1 ABC transporter ATP-binding protein [Actinokineospora globicatena]